MLKVSLHFNNTETGEEAINVFGFYHEAAIVDIDDSLQNLMDNMSAWAQGLTPFSTGYLECINTQWEFTKTKAWQCATTVVDPHVAEKGWAFAGVRAGEPLPGLLSCCVTYRTGYADRRRRGRIFTLPACEGDNADGAAGSVYRGQLIESLESLQSVMATTGEQFQHSVYSEVLNEMTGITSYTANAEWDTQRRRSK